MDVEHAALPMQHEIRREQPHEAGETDEFHAMLVESALECALEGGAILAVRAVVDHDGRNTLRFRASQPRGVRPVRDHEHDFGRIGAVLRRLDQRRHVGAAPGNQNGDAFPGHALTK